MNNAKRIKRLQTLIERVKGGEDVARRDLKLALTADEWKDYEALVEQNRFKKELFLEVPADLKKYARLLKKGDFPHSRAEAMARNGNPYVRRRLFEQSEAEYGKALEFLGEALQISPDLVMWLDREFSLTPEKYCSPDPTSVPRLITSVSGYREKGLESLVGKRRMIKLDALQSSLEYCLTGNEQLSSIESQTIKSVLPSKKTKKKIDV